MTQWVVIATHHTRQEPFIWSTPFGNKTDAESYMGALNKALTKHYTFDVQRLDKLGKKYANGFYFETNNSETPEPEIIEAIRAEEP